MAKIMVGYGEIVKIGFLNEDGIETDGGFEVHYNSKEHPDSLLIKESEGLSGSVKGKANEILYQEDFGEKTAHDFENWDRRAGLSAMEAKALPKLKRSRI